MKIKVGNLFFSAILEKQPVHQNAKKKKKKKRKKKKKCIQEYLVPWDCT